ncbi:MAG: hypothetical protein COA79_08180 [Planctomycetota bacterium]|nr:MAG: hypothetical protein COA79_08180 [Planctomycetota bacterium]
MNSTFSLADSTVNISIAGYFPCKPSWSIPKNRNINDCLFYIEKGKGWIELDGENIETKAGDLHILKQGQICKMNHDPKDCFSVYSVLFLFLQPGMQRPFESLPLSRMYRLSKSQQKKIKEQYKSTVYYFNAHNPAGDLKAKSIILNVLSEIIEWEKSFSKNNKVKSTTKTHAVDSRIGEIINYIDANLSSELTVPQLAEESHLTTSHFSKLFKEETGQSPISFIRNNRINCAKALLISSDKTISKIALECGFEDHFYFSRTFKQIVGLSPKQFKESLKNPFF